MAETLKVLVDWGALTKVGPDAVIYFVMATSGTILFLIRLTFAMFAGGDGDFDASSDAGHGDDTFSVFSLLSILAFFMGAGWMGLACRFDFGLSGPLSSVIAAGFGFGMMMLASVLMYMTRKLNRQIDYDVSSAIGRTARVYLTIPARGTGHGEVQVTVSGRRKVLRARSSGPEIPAFADVIVESVMDDETLVVAPLADDSP